MEARRLHLSKGGKLDVEFVESDTLTLFEQLAREAIDESRKSIMMAMRYLNTALWQLPPERALLARPLATNGRVLQFDPERVVERYRTADSELVRDCLHVVLHCLFHHPFEKRHGEYPAWSLASDIAVELCAIELAGERFPSKLDEERLAAGKHLAGKVRSLTAPALYQLFRCGPPGEALYLNHGLIDQDLTELTELFKRDAHDLWATHPRGDELKPDSRSEAHNIPDLQACSTGLTAGKADDDADAGQAEGVELESPDETDGKPAQAQSGTATEPESNATEDFKDFDVADEETAEEWKRISKRVEAELRVQRHSLHGKGGLLKSLTVANRKPANYDEFLRRFATMAEDMHVSDEEFDYVYYTYGLSRYGNVPLVEPLEYQEQKRVREFVIAIDTSGSCSGELVRTFVERTYDILRLQTSFGDHMNVHIVQCDNRVRAATKVASLAQLESYADSFWVSGGGGTDFKPVFEYVDSLVESGEFDDLRGLIYFTDGYGTFPTRAPDYETAFVFVEDEDTTRKVPGWAMKVTMTQDEVLQQ